MEFVSASAASTQPFLAYAFLPLEPRRIAQHYLRKYAIQHVNLIKLCSILWVESYEQRSDKRYSVVVISPGDRSAVGPVYNDKRWSTKLCEISRQLFVSVGYRLPLKYNYSFWWWRWCNSLSLQVCRRARHWFQKDATSGFSVGGHLSFSSIKAERLPENDERD